MEYATEVLDWLKKQAEVAAGRNKRCPAGDPTSLTYSAEVKVLGRNEEQLGPLVHPATVSDCGSAPSETASFVGVPVSAPTDIRIVNSVACACAAMINVERFICDTTSNLSHFQGARVGTAWKAPNYLTFQDATSASECLKGMLIPKDLERLFPEESHSVPAGVGAQENLWMRVQNGHVVETSQALRWLLDIEVLVDTKESTYTYSSLEKAEEFLLPLICLRDRSFVYAGLAEMRSLQSAARPDKRITSAGLAKPMVARYYE